MERTDTICLIGWGAIGTRLAALLAERGGPARIVAVGLRPGSEPRAPLPEGARVITDPGDLAATAASLVIEAAGREAVMPWGRAALAAGMDYAVSSASALADDEARADLVNLAAARGAQLLLPPGALAGIDALAAVARLGLDSVEHRIIKPPRAWVGTPAEAECDLAALTAARVVHRGPARQVAAAFPQNANVAVISSLAGIGLDRTEVVVVADPAARNNIHEIAAEGAFGRLDVRIENRPLASNPKTSETTVLNLLRLVENRAAALVV